MVKSGRNPIPTPLKDLVRTPVNEASAVAKGGGGFTEHMANVTPAVVLGDGDGGAKLCVLS